MAQSPTSAYNGQKMTSKREARIVLWASAGAALLTLVPYLAAARLAPSGTVFSGFLINPVDGFSYLAKMRQGAQGGWSFILPYAAEPGAGAFIFGYYLFLGHLSAWLDLPLLTVYHTARVLAAFLMYLAAFHTLRWLLGSWNLIRFGWVLVVLGSGLGWISLIAFNHPASDMLIPESIPSLSAIVNAHFPLAVVAFLLAIRAVGDPGLRVPVKVLMAGISGATLGLVLPFAAVGLTVILGTWVAVERLLRGHEASRGSVRRWGRAHLLPLLVFGLALIPWLLYDGWLSLTHPVLRVWSAQNQTPSPPVWDFAIGFGVVLVLALYGISARSLRQEARQRLLLVWFVAGSLMLYAPVAFQRRMSLGLYIALAALAALGASKLSAAHPWRKWVVLLAIALALPSNLLLLGASLIQTAGGNPELVHTRDELAAFAWIGEHTTADDLVLASEAIGNRLPAFTPAKVLYGHPFETPDAETAAAEVRSLFSVPEGEAGIDRLRTLGVTYVFYGLRERALGEPGWLSSLGRVALFGDVELYQVPDR